ncbi:MULTISPECIES: roadblock/LC7 domain-containing protein [Streptomyces]|uniref:roadblock/LC7 domain-containing protein n=1 Tax=Streptomyces TaxID=1883 RepID=UPI00163BA3A1|nr:MULTISPECIES: roadblock/LC7 domain-containing protein [Streptomyces]MBC2876289.1 roadblock/LC7 domain-containing protein [Streptomyces sp. TYQ1024]UBI35492.1 roadblock/LC7 domain-containing protein [Streptomyces mobaraensis]UKW28084.1 roadblock/LC7 domain-containing protein [Streptomyces sp. TYQ1024]
MGLGKGFGKGFEAILDDLTRRAEGIRHALVLSNDGLVTGASEGLTREDAEHLAAVASGLHSLAQGTGRQFRAGRVRQTMIEFDGGVLFVTAAGDENCLCVLGSGAADVGTIAYEMTVLADRVAARAAGAGGGSEGPGRGSGLGDPRQDPGECHGRPG